jgi:hypothetical protein
MALDRPQSPKAAVAIVDLLARLGLAHFTLRLGDAPQPALRLLLQEADAAARGAGLADLDWEKQRARLLEALHASSRSPLKRFCDSLALEPCDIFLMGLAVACESRPSVAFAVSALQDPFPVSRPSAFLALELLDALFEAKDGDVLALENGPLVASGFLRLEGTDAAPRRALAPNLALWRALCGGAPRWPGCAAVDEPTDPGWTPELEAAAVALASGEAEGIVLRAPPGAGRARAAAALARRLGLAAIETSLSTFNEDRAYATACRTAGWAPVLRVSPDVGEAVTIPRAPSLPHFVLAGPRGAVLGGRLFDLALAPPPIAEREKLWRVALGDSTDAPSLSAALLYPAAIEAHARVARLAAMSEAAPVAAAHVARARVTLAPSALARLAHPVTRRVGPDALVTTPELAGELAALIARCRRRETVWEGLGPSLAASAGAGVRALFYGESGTGKSMAAAYVATALGAPLYRCDLGAVMNKYIGESEKNLGALLDFAEAADVALLFDEADALFGRRSDGAETGERYANMLTNYLLTRLEAHNGVVMLTTNARSRIDPAFWRRLDCAIDFPTPGYVERLALWKSHLGRRAPPQATLERLAECCDLAGGGVRNVVLAAAALTPGTAPLGLDVLAPAVKREYAKQRRSLPAQLALVMRAAG